tara:strand:+ start:1857 stop:2741 length:885 start_codon:yes stop_codon:yes gene_type:complete
MVKLEDYTIGELKKMISSFNKIVKFSAYSKLKKAELINMLRHHKRIIVEEGANGVKIMIDTEEDFKKQPKVKKEKVKKEVKKEVEKLDDVKLVVKPEKKKKFNVIPTESQKIAKSLKLKYTDHKKDLSDFGKAETIGYIKQDIKREEINLKELNRLLKDATDKEAFRKSSSADMKAIEKALELYKNDLKELEKKKIKFKVKEEPVKKEEKELNEKTLNMILKADKDILLKPADVALDPKRGKKIQRLYNKLFNVYEKSYGDLLDKYNISKSNYSQKAIRIFGGLIKEARKQSTK